MFNFIFILTVVFCSFSSIAGFAGFGGLDAGIFAPRTITTLGLVKSAVNKQRNELLKQRRQLGHSVSNFDSADEKLGELNSKLKALRIPVQETDKNFDFEHGSLGTTGLQAKLKTGIWLAPPGDSNIESSENSEGSSSNDDDELDSADDNLIPRKWTRNLYRALAIGFTGVFSVLAKPLTEDEKFKRAAVAFMEVLNRQSRYVKFDETKHVLPGTFSVGAIEGYDPKFEFAVSVKPGITMSQALDSLKVERSVMECQLAMIFSVLAGLREVFGDSDFDTLMESLRVKPGANLNLNLVPDNVAHKINFGGAWTAELSKPVSGAIGHYAQADRQRWAMKRPRSCWGGLNVLFSDSDEAIFFNPGEPNWGTEEEIAQLLIDNHNKPLSQEEIPFSTTSHWVEFFSGEFLQKQNKAVRESTLNLVKNRMAQGLCEEEAKKEVWVEILNTHYVYPETPDIKAKILGSKKISRIDFDKIRKELLRFLAFQVELS